VNIRPKVTFLHRFVSHYRVPFFTGLAQTLEQRGIEFELIYGQHLPGTVPESVDLDTNWAKRVENRYINLAGSMLLWQPCWRLLRDSRPDLIIVEQANNLLINYLLLLWRSIGGAKLAYYGHGRNMQSASVNSMRERWKRFISRRADWWFGYTELTRQIVIDSIHYPSEQITVVNNAIDTQTLKDAVASATDHELALLRQQTKINGDRIALYCGGLYSNKRLDFLLEACLLIKQRVPGFEMLFIGKGPDQEKVVQMANEHAWIHYLGAKYGTEIAPYLKLADVTLMPGLVGLAILDAFAGEAPMFTTDINFHSPEIAYLEHGVNGIISANRLDAYVDAVCNCLNDVTKLDGLKNGCRESANRYTLTNMITRFADGIESCLGNGIQSRKNSLLSTSNTLDVTK
jgi:glycosyltransferase involved in cell wall biosynthesis